MKPRFLLDEHINRAIQRQLRRQTPELEILAIGDPGLRQPEWQIRIFSIG
jgi:hypothetical protein